MKQYDAIIIGSGQAANPLASRLAAIGWKVALVEKKHIGGTCINEGCTPTKTMVASAKAAFQSGRAKEYGLKTSKACVDIIAVLNRKDAIVNRFRSGLQSGLSDQENVDILFGEAVFTGDKQIAVTDAENRIQQYTSRYVFINTGARPFIPYIKGLDTVPYLTSSSLLNLQKVPDHLVIIGAGPVAIEFAQIYRRFGSEVTMISRSHRLLLEEDPDVGEEIRSILADEGVSVVFNTNVSTVGMNDNGLISLLVNQQSGQHTLTGTHLLIATGRRPNSDTLHLEKTGVETDEHGYIIVNERLETTAAGIYALGDVKGGPAFTHISYNDYLVVYKNIVENKHVTIKDRPVPYCIFTDPEFARIGLNETEALEQNIPFKIAKMPMSWVARATETGEAKGFMKVIVHADTNKILGVAIIGIGGGELMSLLQVAMLGGVTADQLSENIFAHPTYAESMNNLFHAVSMRPV
jgi:pyruvate/2-oxoglutarate dehydrogenase complex dihydrolipoamide dehydrogenase (E3) component